ncbi:MAG: SulP family inorganic anion transporter [Hyphomicrobiales bacterium]
MIRVGPQAFLRSLAGYDAGAFRVDFSAGLAIAAVALPSAIAYPAIAGLPAVVGIYASMVPLVGYAVFGSSRQLVVGPDAATMTVLAAVLAAAAIPAGDPRVAAAAALALAVGSLCFLASLLRLGFVASFLSRPILVGFMTGIALSIIVGQIKRLTGVRIDSEGLVAPVLELVRKASDIHWPTLLLGIGFLALLQLLMATQSIVPGPIAVIVLGVMLSYLFDFPAREIAVVGDIPAGLPGFSLPSIDSLGWRELVLGSAAIWLVSFGAGIVTARSFGARGKFDVDPNAELIGFGAANVAAGLFSGFPVTASDSRTAINTSIGGRTQIASLVAAAALALILLYLNGVLRDLPVVALGAILVSAALSLIDVEGLKELWRISRIEFAFAVLGMWGVLSLGVLNGVVVALSATLVYVLVKSLRPRDAFLGLIPGRDGFYKLHRTPAARRIPGLTLFVIQGSLLFYNVDYVKARFEEILDALPADVRWFVIDAGAIAQLDSTSVQMLGDVAENFRSRGIAFGLAELNSEPRALLARAGVLEAITPRMVFEDLEDVRTAFETSRVAAT